MSGPSGDEQPQSDARDSGSVVGEPIAQAGTSSRKILLVVAGLTIPIVVAGMVGSALGLFETSSGSIEVTELGPGDCFNIDDVDPESNRLRVRSCDEPHDAQFF